MFGDSLTIMSSHTRALAEWDALLGKKADSVSTEINAALALNLVLDANYLACPAAIYSGTVGVLKAEAESVAAAQNAALKIARFNAFWGVWNQRIELNLPKRVEGLVPPCSLPANLKCDDEKIFSFESRNGLEPAGVEGESQNCMKITWKYSDERVKPL